MRPRLQILDEWTPGSQCGLAPGHHQELSLHECAVRAANVAHLALVASRRNEDERLVGMVLK